MAGLPHVRDEVLEEGHTVFVIGRPDGAYDGRLREH